MEAAAEEERRSRREGCGSGRLLLLASLALNAALVGYVLIAPATSDVDVRHLQQPAAARASELARQSCRPSSRPGNGEHEEESPPSTASQREVRESPDDSLPHLTHALGIVDARAPYKRMLAWTTPLWPIVDGWGLDVRNSRVGSASPRHHAPPSPEALADGEGSNASAAGGEPSPIGSTGKRSATAEGPGPLYAGRVVPRPVLRVPPDVRRVCIDVGTFVTSPSSRNWWSSDNRTFVIAFETNIFYVTMMSRLAHPTVQSQLVGYMPSCRQRNDPDTVLNVDPAALLQCYQRYWGHITSHFDRFLMIPVALSEEEHFTTFMLGFPNRSDGGSLLSFNSQMMAVARRRNKGRAEATAVERIPTSVATLGSVLPYLPTRAAASVSPGGAPPLAVSADWGALLNGTPPRDAAHDILWDTLKIDAQGVDSLVIQGAGRYLSQFACVIGEWDMRAYKAKKRFPYRKFLVVDLGFVLVSRALYVNPRYYDAFERNELLCSAQDVRESNAAILARLRDVMKERKAAAAKLAPTTAT